MKQVLKKLAPGDILFHEEEPGKAMYIVKRGIIRLFKPKGRGYIELATVHAGEIIGEMALFEEGHSRRSCSAEAIVETELVEISFEVFRYILDKSNPWFQTIINTLVSRLITANKKIKAYETNSVKVSYNRDSGSEYQHLSEIEVIRLFICVYLAFLDDDDGVEDELEIADKVLLYYAEDYFNLSETKIREFMQVLESQGFIETEESEEERMVWISISREKLEDLKRCYKFFNKERSLKDEKRINLTNRCLMLFDSILRHNESVKHNSDRPTISLQKILEDLKDHGVELIDYDFLGAVKHDFMQDPFLDKNNKMVAVVNLGKIVTFFPLLRMKNALKDLNSAKKLK